MIILDASALIALLMDERGASKTQLALSSNDQTVMTTINYAECVDVLLRNGVSEGSIRHKLFSLTDSCLKLIDIDQDLSWRCGTIHSQLYRHKKRSISIADCSMLAVAGVGDTIFTRDTVLANAAREMNLKVTLL